MLIVRIHLLGELTRFLPSSHKICNGDQRNSQENNIILMKQFRQCKINGAQFATPSMDTSLVQQREMLYRKDWTFKDVEPGLLLRPRSQGPDSHNTHQADGNFPSKELMACHRRVARRQTIQLYQNKHTRSPFVIVAGPSDGQVAHTNLLFKCEHLHRVEDCLIQEN